MTRALNSRTPIIGRDAAKMDKEASSECQETTPLLPGGSWTSRENSSPLCRRQAVEGQGPENRSPSKRVSVKQWLEEISIPTYGLVILMTFATMLRPTGVIIEMPLLVQSLPEGWSLPSYTTLAQQAGKVGPFIYITANYFSPGKSKDVVTWYTTGLIAVSSYIIMAVFWQETVSVAGDLHSVPFILMVGCVAAADTAASIAGAAFIAGFKPQYMTALYLGKACGGFLPSIFGFIQGVPQNPSSSCISNDTSHPNSTAQVGEARFSASVFWVLLACLYSLSIVAFSILNYSAMCRKEKVKNEILEATMVVEPSDRTSDRGCDSGYAEEEGSVGRADRVIVFKMTPRLALLIGVYCLTVMVSGVVIAPLGSYSFMPYGADVYGIALKGLLIVLPLVCILSVFTPNISARTCALVALFGLLPASYIVSLAAMSPHPPLQGDVLGSILAIVSNIVQGGSLFFAMVTSGILARKAGGRTAMIWCGGLSEVVDLIGAGLMFALVNVMHVFTSAEDECP